MNDTTSAVAVTLEPVEVAPRNYKLLLENDRVRVFDVTIDPGEKLALHANGPSVIYVFNDGCLRHTYPDGSVRDTRAVSGTVVWDQAEMHETENTGQTQIHSLKIELKTS
jgi:hypothetical protein